MSRVSVILVNWNGWRDTLECLDSLLGLDYPDFDIAVCDNASGDDSAARIREWAASRQVTFAEYDRQAAEGGGDGYQEGGTGTCNERGTGAWRSQSPKVTLIHTGANLGFAGGNNVGLRYALARGASFCWLLNNDTVVEPDALSQLCARMEADPGIGMCGSTIRYYQDRDRVQALGGGYYCRWIGLPWHHGRFTRGGSAAGGRAEARMNYVEGASMLVSRRFLLEVGLLCEDYFLFFEEADWAERARGRFTLGYAPGSVVYHKVGQSIGTSSNPAKKSTVCDFYNIRNRILFARRHHPVTLPTVYLVLGAELMLRFLCGKWDRGIMIARLMLSAGNCGAVKP
ncbi:glycosyltransferase family 2 protein [Geomonas paludis]|uniref:Glycosyl transferase family 2 n=1 Tax=Geomonas paludis TaxID=2740185 RepID=A0A6V8MW09_9BACT|nr:glycosyltransferase family 2 protein [Geomonas paludis]UPU34390.1 glycosyltransferase family 2 protein [Geomonas paludis]GFO64375.1 glycosyl transferase family 2 [Geomonas paludis]